MPKLFQEHDSENMDVNFFTTELDEFGETDIHAVYPMNPNFDVRTLQSDYMNEPDNLFGLGNQKKRAERKLRKAEKKLAHGKTKKAEKKLRKAGAILGKYQSAQQKYLQEQQQLGNINATAQVINPMDTTQTESMQTAAGQLGSIAKPVSNTAEQSTAGLTGGGGGGGGMDADTGTSPDTSPDTSGSTLSTAENPKILPDVTITAKKPNYILLIVVAIVAIGLILFLSKKKK